jgi:HlyD family secretion protein
MTARLTGPRSIPLSFAEAEAASATPSVRKVMRAALLLLFLGFGGLLGWAAITPVERAVVARGALVAEGLRKTIMLQEPGILQFLAVREGDRVQAGQLLFRLDPATADAAAAQARAALLAQQVRIARLAAEQQDQRSFVAPGAVIMAAQNDPALAAIVQAEGRLFGARWQNFDGSISVQQRRIQVIREQLQAATSQRGSAERRLASIRADLAGLRPLAQQGFARVRELREMERLEAQVSGDLGSYNAQEAQYRQAIAQAELEMAAFRLQRSQDIAKELQEAQQAMVDAEQRVLAAESVRARREVVAPEAGVVTNLRFFTPGSSITDGQPVLELLPIEDRLIFEIKASPNDVEQLSVGKRVNVRLLALRMRTTPLLHGHLTYVAADQALDPQNVPFFLARGEIDPNETQRIPGLVLNAGMPVEVYVLGETRSALSYLVAPIRDSMRRALRD